MRKLDLRNERFQHWLTMVVIVFAFGGLGSALLINSRAATPTASVEPENGTVSSAAGKVTDTTASNGQAIKFGSGGSGIPAQCNSGGAYLWSNLATCGWPDATNTGYDLSQCPGGQLTVNSGATNRVIHVTTANSTMSCQNITGCLSIEAANVTISNVKIACTSGKTGTNANGTSVIYVDDGASATVTHTEINGMDGVHACIWHQGTALTATAVNCYGIDDGIFSWADTSFSQTTGDHFTIQDSYFHDFTTKTANGHIDGYQTEGAGNGLISHNTFLMTSDASNSSDSAIAIWNSLKSSHDITVQNNLMTGGGFTVYAEDYDPSDTSPSGGFSVTNMHFTNNKFSTNLLGGCVGDFGVWFYRAGWSPYQGGPTDLWNQGGSTRSGNTVLETGENIDNSNPHSGGTLCS